MKAPDDAVVIWRCVECRRTVGFGRYEQGELEWHMKQRRLHRPAGSKRSESVREAPTLIGPLSDRWKATAPGNVAVSCGRHDTFIPLDGFVVGEGGPERFTERVRGETM